MIAAINLNPCIDLSIQVQGFQYGELNRVLESRSDPSGKGINVGIALKNLGREVKCLGFNYRDNGDALKAVLEQKEIGHRFVEVDGRLRINVKILDTVSSVMTEMNEQGGKVRKEDVCSLRKMIREETEDSGIVVIGGSVPNGVEKEIYREIISDLSGKGKRIILDAEKELLEEGVKAKPYLIKPNLYELETTFQRKCKDIGEVVLAARDIIRQGVQVVCVSMGEKGAVICSEESAYYAPAIPLDIKGYQGAGDSMVAGICCALEEKKDIREMLRYGMAASAASLIREGTQLCEKQTFDKYLEQIEIREVGEKYAAG